MDGQVELAGAAFFNDVRDGQLFDFDGTTFALFFGNQDYQSYGAEFEVAADITPYTTVRGALGLTQTRPGLVDPNSLSALNGAMEGNEVPNAPNMMASAGLDVRYPIYLFGASSDAILSADVSYTGARQGDVGNSYEIPGYTIANEWPFSALSRSDFWLRREFGACRYRLGSSSKQSDCNRGAVGCWEIDAGQIGRPLLGRGSGRDRDRWRRHPQDRADGSQFNDQRRARGGMADERFDSRQHSRRPTRCHGAGGRGSR